MDYGLKGKNAVITGSGGGFGKALAYVLAKEGVNVIVHDLPNKVNETQKICAELRNIGVEAEAILADMSNQKQVLDFFEKAKNTFDIDILVNNAAIWPTAYVEEMTTESFAKTLDINMTAPFILCREAVNYFKKQGKPGKIVNMVSQAAFHGSTSGHAHYAASKAGIPDLEERTVGIIGYGEIGRLVARKLSGFNMNVLIYDPYCRDNSVKTVELEELLTKSDFVTLHARLTKENEHMIGAKELAMMKKTAYIINTSRSGLIDEKALYEALKNGQLAGAAIDVYDEEPPAIDYPLVTLPNVTLTPHMAGGSNDAFKNTPKRLMSDMKKALEGNIEMCRFLIK